MAEDLGTVNLEKNSEKGRGGEDQSTSRSASIRSSAVTLPQSISVLLFCFFETLARLSRAKKKMKSEEGELETLVGKKETESSEKKEFGGCFGVLIWNLWNWGNEYMRFSQRDKTKLTTGILKETGDPRKNKKNKYFCV